MTPGLESSPLSLLYFAQGNRGEKNVESLSLKNIPDNKECKPCIANKFSVLKFLLVYLIL